jgi:hypothetical protein
MAKGHLRLVSPHAVNGTMPPRRRKNAEVRTREYLTEAEVERLIKAAKANRHGHRDATMILMAFRHGLRRQRSLICGGIRWTWAGTPVCMCTGSRMASPPRIRCKGMKCGLCGS